MADAQERDYWIGFQVEQEVLSGHCDASRVRRMLLDTPGAFLTDQLRRAVWLSLLAVGRSDEAEAYVAVSEEELASFPQRRVVAADVPRTRAGEAAFREPGNQRLLQAVLVRFCTKRRIGYKQGLNELLAPILYLVSQCRKEVAESERESRRLSRERLQRLAAGSAAAGSEGAVAGDGAPGELSVEAEVFELFERFVVGRCVWFYNDGDFRVLQLCLSAFRLLLQYHDPSVATVLEEQHLTPELYAMPWAMTQFARGVPLPQVLTLWDWMVADADAALWLYLGVSLLRRHRESALLSDASNLPQLVSECELGEAEEMRELMSRAVEMRDATPASLKTQLRRALRPQLPSPRTLGELEERLGAPAVSVSARELLESLGGGAAAPAPAERGAERQRAPALPFVVLDVRPQAAVDGSGSGTLAKSMRLEEGLLRDRDALDTWLQHFDAVRGCHICVVGADAHCHGVGFQSDGERGGARPPGAPASAGGGPTGSDAEAARPAENLWRRLLLGEGDGDEGWGPGGGFGLALATSFGLPMSEDACEASAEVASELLDARAPRGAEELSSPAFCDPAMQFALCLVRRGFERVSVLHGGMFELLGDLRRRRVAEEGHEPRDLEPVVVGYDADKWHAWCRRRSELHARAPGRPSGGEAPSGGGGRGGGGYGVGGGDDGSGDEGDAGAGFGVDDGQQSLFEGSYHTAKELYLGDDPSAAARRVQVAAAVAREAEHHAALAHLSVRLADAIASGELPEGDHVEEAASSPRPGASHHGGDLPFRRIKWGKAVAAADEERRAAVALRVARRGRYETVLPFLAERLEKERVLRRYQAIAEMVSAAPASAGAETSSGPP